MTTNINRTLRQLKEYEALKKEAEEQINLLKNEAIEWLLENGVDEYLNVENGDKCTYREVITKRFQSTEFKKMYSDLYNEFVLPSSSMRFTLN